MKIAVCSDLHLEFGDIELKNTEGADVLILSGDILVANDIRDRDVYGVMDGTRSNRYHDFMRRCSEEFKNVVYVAGNHEHYNGDFKYTYAILKNKFEYLKNVHILDRECIEIDGVTFIGSTLWTDMNKRDPLTLEHMKSMMNDFRCVTNSNRSVFRTVPLYQKDENGQYVKDERGSLIQCGSKKKEEAARFSPLDAVEEHEKCLDYIKEVLVGVRERDGKAVVVGHHTPSHKSCHPRYAHDDIMNGGYHSDLSEFILDHPEIKLWTHGHTHELFDYVIGETRIVCNPRGYVGYESISKDFVLKTFDVV